MISKNDRVPLLKGADEKSCQIKNFERNSFSGYNVKLPAIL